MGKDQNTKRNKKRGKKRRTVACQSGKVRYRDQKEAKGVSSHLQREGYPKQRAYLCPTCKGWHLTRQL